jgi:glycosyltransferase involved in cell wall biosynthesis
MAKTKVLYVLHNHPAIHPGGAEQYALELHQAMRSSDDVEPILVARTGPSPGRPPDSPHPGAPFSLVEDERDEYLVFTEWDHFDFFRLTSREKALYSRYFADFLRAQKPDVVHFQHTLFIGCDLVSQVRRTLPHVPILYTLHEYLPICNRDGQLVRTDGELCMKESPRRCNECFPWISKGDFYLRKRFIQSHLENVDLFLAPSHFLRQRYVDWGIPSEKIVFEDYGRAPAHRVEGETREGPRNRLGFFGQLSPYKGIKVLLRAMADLKRSGVGVHLFVHGANLELQGGEFETEVRRLFGEASDNVTIAGPYDHERLPALMAKIDWVVVPSTWWENSPLVIQEAFLHGRPVICSDIGGMAEKVTDGVNGLTFEAGNPGRLSGTIGRAVRTPGLWDELRAGISPVYAMDDHVASLKGHYAALAERAGHPEFRTSLEAPVG